MSLSISKVDNLFTGFSEPLSDIEKERLLICSTYFAGCLSARALTIGWNRGRATAVIILSTYFLHGTMKVYSLLVSGIAIKPCFFGSEAENCYIRREHHYLEDAERAGTVSFNAKQQAEEARNLAQLLLQFRMQELQS